VNNEELLPYIRKFHTQQQVASSLGIDVRTVRRWENGDSDIKPAIFPALRELARTSAASRNESHTFTFADLFAGIGGIRTGFEQMGGKCVYTSEWNKYAAQTYRANFPDDNHDIAGDITTVNENEIPDHDVLLAGFPCQPFSIAGVSKKQSLGREHGFRDKTQGTLFFDVARIIEAKRPKAFLLENVKNLTSHDQGKTFRTICETLTDELGYFLRYRVIDGRHWVPQHRERIILAGFREETTFSFDALQQPAGRHPLMRDILHPENGSEEPESPYTEGERAEVNKKYILTNKLWNYLKRYAAKHQAAGNGFGYGLVAPDSVARTLSARYFKDGSEILVSRGRKNPRRLTPRECARLMGFDTPERKFVIPVSDTQAYRQFGNSVVVPVMREVARIMVPHVISQDDAYMNGQRQLAML